MSFKNREQQSTNTTEVSHQPNILELNAGDLVSALESQAFVVTLDAHGRILNHSPSIREYWQFEKVPERFSDLISEGPCFFDLLAQWEKGESNFLQSFWKWKVKSPRFPEGRWVRGSFFTPPPNTAQHNSTPNRQRFFFDF